MRQSNIGQMRALIEERDRQLAELQQDRDLTDQAKQQWSKVIRDEAAHHHRQADTARG